jgi:hypothetical protein
MNPYDFYIPIIFVINEINPFIAHYTEEKLKKGTNKKPAILMKSFLFSFFFIFFSFFSYSSSSDHCYVITIKKINLTKKIYQHEKYFFFIKSFHCLMNFKISEKFEICKNINLVDLPEIKGQHRKFRTLVTSYIGKVWKSIFIPFF